MQTFVYQLHVPSGIIALIIIQMDLIPPGQRCCLSTVRLEPVLLKALPAVATTTVVRPTGGWRLYCWVKISNVSQCPPRDVRRSRD